MTLYLAANWISATQVYGHLQIVYSPGHDFFEIEVQAPFVGSIPFGGNFVFPPVRDHFGFDPVIGDPYTPGVRSKDTHRIAAVTLVDGQDVAGAARGPTGSTSPRPRATPTKAGPRPQAFLSSTWLA